MWFASYVKQGKYTVKAILTADIDMSGIENFLPIAQTAHISISMILKLRQPYKTEQKQM